MPGPLTVVDPRPLPPASPFGLLSAADLVDGAGDGHWQAGIIWQSPCVTGGTTYDECIVVSGTGGVPPPPPVKVDNVDIGVRGATPFTVYADYQCSPFGDDAVERAADALATVEAWQAERAFWTGQAAGQQTVWPRLQGGTVPTVLAGTVPVTLQPPIVATGGPWDASEALGWLEQQLADCVRALGVVHVPRLVLPALAAQGLVRRNGARLETVGGNRVAAGDGYPATSPAGAAPAPDTGWMVGTGPVFVYRSAVRAFTRPESLNRAENTVTGLAERTYLVGYDCCAVAVAVNLTAT
jgi:hypothetical protein